MIQQSLENDSIADAQLSDPKFIGGAMNVPINTFSFTQEDMTMIGIGFEQAFPAGRSLKMKSNKTKNLASAQAVISDGQ